MKHTFFLLLALPLMGQELKDCKDVLQGPCINRPLLQMLERTWPEEQRTAPFQSPSFVKPPITLDCMTCNGRTLEVKPEDIAIGIGGSGETDYCGKKFDLFKVACTAGKVTIQFRRMNGPTIHIVEFEQHGFIVARRRITEPDDKSISLEVGAEKDIKSIRVRRLTVTGDEKR